MDISISLQEFASLIERAVENGFLAGEQCATRPDEMLTEAQARREFEGFVDFSRAERDVMENYHPEWGATERIESLCHERVYDILVDAVEDTDEVLCDTERIQQLF